VLPVAEVVTHRPLQYWLRGVPACAVITANATLNLITQLDQQLSMTVAIPEDVEVWGAPVTSLPSRPIRRAELQRLGDHDGVDTVRVPAEGDTFMDAPGPAVTDDGDGISEFVLIRDETIWLFRYGFPEVTRGELAVPQQVQRAKREGFVRWWKNELDLKIDEDHDVESEDRIKDWYLEKTVPME